MLSEAEFALVAREVKARSGQMLTPEIAGVIETRLQPIARRETLMSVGELIAAARNRPDGKLWIAITDALAQTETRFFRDRAQFDVLRTKLIPDALKRRGHERIRIWSAGCSTGQEAYSIAMTLEELRDTGVNAAAEIVASDFSDRLLDKARAGLYTQFEVQRGLPIRKLIAHFEKAGDLWRISDRLRASVKFENHNLLKHPGPLGSFDIVILSHVLGAFDAETRTAVIAHAADALAPQGAIVLGVGETLPENCAELDLTGGVVTRKIAAKAAA
ncbi:MAG TPA: protein-glutamate O-methyltransferase CheR [Vitreimonas sp.]|nr:protein-glutamate O-methyltransferase CheR [Vitreimonas sp.]